MTDGLQQAVEGFGALSRVDIVEYQPGWVQSVRLEFESAFLLIEVDNEDDTIIWSSDTLDVASPQTGSAPDDWLPLISFRLRWMWLMTNHRGFRDGIQLELWRDRQTTIIQFMSEGSQLQIYKLEAFDGST